MIFKNVVATGFALSILVNVGCSSMGVHLPWEKSVPTASEKHPVIEVMALWQPGEGRGLDHLPTRGFAGQILFFAAGIETPVKVDGDVSIYVFDDSGSRDEQKKPIHEFNFDAGSWNTYFRDTNFGPAYQVFIPYTRRGSHQANCAIRIKYQPKTGTQMFSDVANIVLKGENKTGVKNDMKQEVQPEDFAATSDKTNDHLEEKRVDENRFDQLNAILKEAKRTPKSKQLTRLEKLLESTNSAPQGQWSGEQSHEPRTLPDLEFDSALEELSRPRNDSAMNKQQHPLQFD